MLGRFGLRRRIAGQEEALALLGFLKEERAAIAEYHGGLPRADAEALAWAEIDALLERAERGDDRRPSGAGVTSQWLPPPLSAYHETAE